MKIVGSQQAIAAARLAYPFDKKIATKFDNQKNYTDILDKKRQIFIKGYDSCLLYLNDVLNEIGNIKQS